MRLQNSHLLNRSQGHVEQYVSVTEIMRTLGISRSTFYRHVHPRLVESKAHSIQIGKFVRWQMSSVIAALDAGGAR